jgi:hypothetical protein
LPLPVLAVALLLLLGREVPAPSGLRERVERAAAEALGDAGLDFGRLAITLPADLHPRVRLLDARLLDAQGRLVAFVPEVEISFSPRELLFARSLRAQEITLTGAVLSLTREADGRVDLVVGTGDGGGAPLGRAAGLAAVPEAFERLFERPELAALRQVRIEGLVVNYSDVRAGRAWTLDGGRLALDLAGGVTRLTGSVSVLSGRAFVSHATISYESPRGSPAARIGVTLTDVSAQDVASQSPALAWLGVLDARVSAALRVEIDERGALGPLSVALKSPGGELRPDPAAPGVRFDLARAFLSYDPVAQAIRFDTVELRSDWGGAEGTGTAYLREIEGGLPAVLLGQLRLRDIEVAPADLYPEPIRLSEATAQFRLRLDPFAVEIAEVAVTDPEAGRVGLAGRIRASPEGWEVALDGRIERLPHDRLLELWPAAFRPGLRDWLARNLTAGGLTGIAAALRLEPGRFPVASMTAGFGGATIRPLSSHPPITGGAGRLSWERGDLVVALDRGHVAAPRGGTLDMAGSTFVIPATSDARPRATIGLVASGPLTAGLSLLDVPRWGFLAGAGLPVDVAQGTAEVEGRIDLRLGPVAQSELDYRIAARLRQVTSDRLVPGRTIAAEALDVLATRDGLEIAGAARFDGIPAEGVWRRVRGEPVSRLTATAEVTPEGLARLGLSLPEGAVAGRGRAAIELSLPAGAAPSFRLRSDLAGLAIDLPQIGWSKPPGATGSLLVEGRLGTPLAVDRIAAVAPGLEAAGDLRLTAAGGFDRLRLSRLAVGGWLDAPVTLTAREGAQTPAVRVEGGLLDLRRAALDGGGDGGGPLDVALDRLQITEGIALTAFEGAFRTEAGLEGAFRGRVNGGPWVAGRVSPQAARVAARVTAEDAGAVLRAAGLFGSAEGGALDMLLIPDGAASYEAQAWLRGVTVRDAPVLASLLNAASVFGLLQQLGGMGLFFNEVSAELRIDPGRVTLRRGAAVGVGLGLSLDGVFDTATGRMDFQGVLSPFYLVNAIGAVLTRPGEGLVGINFTLRGDPAAPEIAVNPLSVLTPGLLREMFRRPPPS